MSRAFHIADVFTSKAFGGNQLAVVPDARGLKTEQMQALAREFNFSESTFVFPPDDSRNTRRVRIFTPGGELPFAGHPTVGTAFVLASIGEIELTGDETHIVFEENVGPVPVTIRQSNGKPVFAQLTAAKIPERTGSGYNAGAIANSLGISANDILGDASAIESWSVGLPFMFVPLKTRSALEKLRIDTAAWHEAIGEDPASQVFLFVQESDAIRARMFMPDFGIPEDPATGSAVAALAGYLGARTSMRDGTLKVPVHQGVEMGRPSLLELEADLSDGRVRAVRVGGASVLIASGTLHV
ncbi:MAG TPA: PhzF family phenazine biosynthesis protein [Gemmatimonadaceae bacterium]